MIDPRPAPPALLLIGHGSRAEEGAEQFRAQVELSARAMARTGYAGAPIGSGFLEFAEPHIDQGIDALVATGTHHVVAVPLVLLAAGHLKNDGPALLDRARRRHPGHTFTYARDLGIHPIPMEMATEMARSALPGRDAGPLETRSDIGEDGAAIVLVGRGSTDPDANSDLYKIARLLSDRRGLPLVEPAFVSLAPPSIPDALGRLQRLGATRIAVVPYFLFSGVLSDRIAAQAADWAANHPHITVACAGAMGPDPRLASLIVDRYAEAISGPVAMNCDCCIYRAPMPGYEERHTMGHSEHHDHHD